MKSFMQLVKYRRKEERDTTHGCDRSWEESKPRRCRRIEDTTRYSDEMTTRRMRYRNVRTRLRGKQVTRQRVLGGQNAASKN